MTEKEIDAMQAGREMDLEIAKQVMAHMEPFALYQVSCPDGRGGCGVNHQDWFDANRVRIPRYSTDISAVWQVIDKLFAGDWLINGNVRKVGQRQQWVVTIQRSAKERVCVIAAEFSLAVCRAALKTLNVEAAAFLA